MKYIYAFFAFFCGLSLAVSATALGQNSTVSSVNPWRIANEGYAKLASTTALLWVPGLASSDECIKTDASGKTYTGACGTGGGGGFAWTPTGYGVSTSTTLGFLNGFLSTASSTFTTLPSLPLTAGYTLRGSSGNTAEATSSLFVSASGNVGVGTVSPSAPLTVKTAAPGGIWTGLRLLDGVGGANYWDIGAVNANSDTDLVFSSSGSTKIRINSIGYVGIGTASPTSKLSVSGDITNSGTIISTKGASDTIQAGSGIYLNGGSGSSFTQLQQGVGRFTIWGFDGATWLERMTINNTSGNLGIGTTSPYAKLSVTNTGSGPSFIVEDTTSPDDSPFVIDASGNVGVGTTTPTHKLDIVGASNGGIHLKQAAQIAINPADSGSFYNGLTFENSGITHETFGVGYTSGGYFGLNYYDGASTYSNLLTVTNHGNVGIGTTNPQYKLEVNGSASTTNFYLPNTTSSALGVIYKGANRFIHNYADPTSDGYNTFVGVNAGNFTMGPGGGASYLGSYNTAVGQDALTSNTTGMYNTAGGFQSLYLNTSGRQNTGFGQNTLRANTTGYYNTAYGVNALMSNTTADGNTAIGNHALFLNATGAHNTALGYQSGYNTIDGTYNTALGYRALYSATSSDNAVAIGREALYNAGDTDGTSIAIGSRALYSSTGFVNGNTAVGFESQYGNTTGIHNTSLGLWALKSNTTANYNTAIGMYSMLWNSTGGNNTALGAGALLSNTTGYQNTANGVNALYYNQSATNTTALGSAAGQGTALYSNQGGVYVGYQSGYSAGTGSNYNTMLGYQSGWGVTTGANNILLGYNAGYSGTNLTTGSNNIIIGHNIGATSSDQTRGLNIGNLIFGTGLDGSGTTLSTGNVGVGTTTPASKLSVAGDMLVRDYLLVGTTSPDTRLTNFLADFIGNGNRYYTVNIRNLNAGGTASADLTFNNDKTNTTGTSYYSDIGFNSSVYTDTTYTGFNQPNQSYWYNTDGAISLFTATTSSAGYLSFGTGGTATANERMRIDYLGNTMFGTTTATTSALTVVPTNSQTNVFSVNRDASGYGRLAFRVISAGKSLFNGSANNPTPAGLVHIYHYFVNAYDPIYDYNVSTNYPLLLQNANTATASSTGIGFTVTNTDNNVGGAIVFERTGSNSMGKLHFLTKRSTTANADPAIALTVNDTGDVGIGTTTPWRTLAVAGTAAITGLTPASGTPNSVCINGTTKELTENAALTCTVSARDQKHDINPLSFSAIERIARLEPVSFVYNDHPERTRYGFIADDVQVVDPRFGDAYDQNGNARSLDTNAILAVTVKAVQELANQTNTVAVQARNSAEENLQWVFIGLLILGMLFQHQQIIKLKKHL